MKNVVNYFRREIADVEIQISNLMEERQKPGYKHWSSGHQGHDEKIKMLELKIIALRELLEEALNAQRLLDASKQQ